MKILAYLTLLILLISTVSALNLSDAINVAASDLQGQQLPKPLGFLFSDEQINFHIALDDGNELVFGLITEKGQVKSLSSTAVPEPSLNVYSDEATIKELLGSDNPSQLLKKALDEKKVTYKAVGFVNKIKFAFLSGFSSIVSLFSGNEEEINNNNEVMEDSAEETNEESNDDEAGNDSDVEDFKELPEEQNDLESEEELDDNTLTGNVAAEISEEPKEPQQKTHVIYMDNSGFNPTRLVIGVGDKVVWENTRTGSIKNAMVIGVRSCRDVKSGLFYPGETYEWTFEDAGECIIVDGIMTTQTTKIIIGG